MTLPEGWARLPMLRRFHYFLGETSICTVHRLKEVPTFEADTPPESAQCMTCRHQVAHLAADRAKLANWNRAVGAVREAGGTP